MHSDVEGRPAGGATPASAVLPLNVGGVPFATTRATLCSVPDSMLASMFSGRFHVERDETGRYFIDRDGQLFGHILNFLRTGALPKELDDNDGVRRALAAEADFYQLRELAACLTRNFLVLSDSPHLLGSFTFQLPGREWLWAPAAPPAAAAAAGPGEAEAGEAGVAVGPPGLYLLLASVCARVADDAPRGKMEGCAQLLVNGTVCSLTHGPEYGLFCTVHFAELLHLQRHDAITVRAVDLPIAQMPALKGAAVPSRLALLPLPAATPALQAFGVGHCEDSDVMKWGCARLPPSGLGLDADGQVEVRQAGTYLLLAKTCVECAAYHATAARLVLNGECFAELDHRSAGANHQKLQSYFHDVLYLPVGAQLRLHTGALAAAPPDHLANRLNLIYVGAADSHAVFQATGCPGQRAPWQWARVRGNARLVEADAGHLAVRQAGTYLVLGRVPVSCAYNDACTQLLVGGRAVAEAWGTTKKDRKGIHYFLETLRLATGDVVSVRNINAIASCDASRQLETNLTFLLLHPEG